MKIKEKKGITLIILVITIIIMAILAGTIVVTISGTGEVQKLNSLASDLQVLQERVNLYYEKNKELPIVNYINEEVSAILGENQNPNDGELYSKINLSLLGNLKLTYGNEEFEKDYFIVNNASHMVYYYAGVLIDNEMYYGIKDITGIMDIEKIEMESFEIKAALFGYGDSINSFIVTSDIQNDNIYGYRFKINDGEWTDIQKENYYIIEDVEIGDVFKISMMVVDKNNDEIYASNSGQDFLVDGSLFLAATSIGDYIAYNAGNWNAATDEAKITSSGGHVVWGVQGGGVSREVSVPSGEGSFLIYKDGSSRNASLSRWMDYYEDYNLWRIFSINDDNTVTIISEGSPEQFIPYTEDIEKSEYILKNRDCSMYENKYAIKGSAHILTAEEALEAFNGYYGRNLTLSDWLYNNATYYYHPLYSDDTSYWLASKYDDFNLYYIDYDGSLNYGYGSYNDNDGIRIVLKLPAFLLITSGNGTDDNPYQLKK